MKYLSIIIGLLFLSSCYTERRAQQQLIKAHSLYPAAVASLCGNIYPPLEFVKDSFIYLPGKELPAAIKYVQIDCDTVPAGNRVVTLPCPPCRQYAPDTIAITRHTQAVNRAKEKELQYNIDELNGQLSDCSKNHAVQDNNIKELKEEKRTLWTVLIAIAAYLVIKTVLRIGFPQWSFITRWLI